MEAVAITGASGTLGQALLSRLTGTDVHVRACSRSEKAQLSLRSRYPDIDFRIGDVQDRAFVRSFVDGCDLVIHCAALKHVPLSEAEPTEYTKVNVLGSIVVAEEAAAVKARAVGISTDKACFPVLNAYGYTKALMERIFVEQGHVCVRYGNVLGSSGSVIELWQQQIAERSRITVTDPDMTRFYFPVEDAVKEVLWCAKRSPAGTVTVPELRSVEIGELARAFLASRGAPESALEVVGARPGERRHEWILSGQEALLSAAFGRRRVFPVGAKAIDPPFELSSATAERVPFSEMVAWIQRLATT